MGKGLDIAKECNIRYMTPGESNRSAMPIGNGELAASVWTNKNGNIELYLSRTDTLSELDRTLKLGKVSVSFSPNPFVGTSFLQELCLTEGCISLSGAFGYCKIFIGESMDTLFIQGEFSEELEVTASYYTWRTEASAGANDMTDKRIKESADSVRELPSGICFFHKNGENLIMDTLKNQSLEEYRDIVPDFLTNRIFGGILTGGGTYRTKSIDIRVYTRSAQETEGEFCSHLQEMVSKELDVEQEKRLVEKRWEAFWEKSYIRVQGDCAREPQMFPEMLKFAGEPRDFECDCKSAVTRAYTLTKYMQTCCAAGKFPLFYNGLLFQLEAGNGKTFDISNFGECYTAQPTELSLTCNPDYRSWSREHLWQNLRHPYFTMLKIGEADSLKVLFRYFRNFWQINRARAEKYYGAKGQHSTEMTLSFGLQSVSVYGENRKDMRIGYARNRWGGAIDISPGLELVNLMLDYYDFTGDTEFLRDELLVYAKDLLLYIETRFPNRYRGRMVIGPLQAVETYFDTLNPITVVAGLHGVVERILKIPCEYVEEYKYFETYKEQIPEIPVDIENNEKILQPAMAFADVRYNVELPEMYTIFPFDLVNTGIMEKELGVHSFEERTREADVMRPFILGNVPGTPSYSGWQYSGVVAARLGLTDICKEILENNCALQNPGYRFPAMWGPTYDSVPDVDHGANIMNLLQEMILRTSGSEIKVLPAFPEDWKVEFKLYQDAHTVIEGDEKNFRKYAV